MIVSQRLVRLCRSSQVGVICAFIITGTITSGLSPMTMPKNPGGVTPTIVIGRPLSEMLRLSTDGIAGEAPHPEGVAEHRDRMSSRRAVVVRREGAADLRAHAEDVEVVAGDQLAVHALGLSVGQQRQRRGEARDHAVEHRCSDRGSRDTSDTRTCRC